MLIKNRNFYRITRFLLLMLPYLFKLFAKFRIAKKRVLIIKIDAIGDYILFRNYIEIVKTSDSYKDYQIDLLGNAVWKDIALEYDNQFINEFLFIKPDSLYNEPLNTVILAWKLFKNNYQIVFHPTYARTLIADGLAAFTSAKQIIGFEGNDERINIRFKTVTDKFYTQKLLLPVNTIFEFERNKSFFERVLNHPVKIAGPFIGAKKKIKQGIVIFPGAGVHKRSWDIDKILALIKLIRQHSTETIFLAGSEAELQMGYYITKNLPPGSVKNLIGKTTLPQLILLIGNAALVISSETSAVHIAVAAQTNTICILGGGHFKRFAPYPEYMQNKPVCIFEKMECYNCNWNCKFQTNENDPYPCLSTIELSKVWLATKQLLSAI